MSSRAAGEMDLDLRGQDAHCIIDGASSAGSAVFLHGSRFFPKF
jgi:hypothetical protein